MNISDFISFIGILLAIIAFIGEKERLFVINKFNKIDILLIIITFFFINYLLFYDWWRKVFPILKEFEYDNFPSPNTWVYFIIVLFICWLFYKILFSKFPKYNQNRVIKYYNQLLQREDFSFLYSIIYKYEKNHLLKKDSNSRYHNDLIKTIFLNKDFLFKTSNYNYQLFNKILLRTDNLDDIISDNYIECHIKNPNSFIFNAKNNKIEQEEFFLLAKKTKRLESILIYILRYNLVPLDKLLNFILVFSLNNGDVNELYRIILQEIVDKEDTNALKLFFIEYLEHTRRNNTIASFQAITMILIEKITYIEITSIFKDILQKYLDVIMLLIIVDKNEIERILLDTFKTNRNNNSKKLIRKIYDYYFEYHQHESKELEILFDDIYN